MIDVVELIRFRGDTHPIELTLTESGALLDVTDSSFILTVNAKPHPDENDLPEMTIVGVIQTPATDGVIWFTMSESDADRVGSFHFDIQQTDVNGYVRTVMRGTFEMRQDITKNPVHLWTASDSAEIDGTDGLLLLKHHANDTAEYTVRDTIPILRVIFNDADNPSFRSIVPDLPTLDLTRAFRYSGLVYMDESWWCQITIAVVGFSTYHSLYFENEPGYRSVQVGGHWPHEDGIVSYNNSSSGDLALTAGWNQFEFEWNPATLKMYGKMWDPAGAEPDWQVETQDGEEKPLLDGITKAGGTQFGMATAGISNAEIAWLRIEVLP